ncbi:MAG: hypothetical protein LBH45_04550 [Campylobacteraceae bacterium]|nr:hypothetical protein [Campylobacteraceae bacterium]
MKVLSKGKPDRPCLFEFLIHQDIENLLSGSNPKSDSQFDILKNRIKAFYNAGYDFVPLLASPFCFIKSEKHTLSSYSLNEGGVISSRADFQKYIWNDPTAYSYDLLDKLSKELPNGMKFLVKIPDGILENIIAITSFETLCYLLYDEEDLVVELFENIGFRIVKYFEMCASHKSVGILFCNDDWGFKSSTMISHSDLKRFVYPHYIKVAELAHSNGKACAMHSCGCFDGIYEDLFNVIKFDGKHSNEDTILPVEDAYKRYGDKIAILGGIDINFLCKAPKEKITERCHAMLDLSANGGYALGSGNSIANYVPVENYLAMIQCVNPNLKI